VEVTIPPCTTDGCDDDAVVVQPAGVIDEVTLQACMRERANLDQVLQTYELLEGAPPANEADLVPNYLRAESVLYDLADGAVVPAPGSACT
jgi:hypothetical protein